jgi:carboxyl-terminal processing protease
MVLAVLLVPLGYLIPQSAPAALGESLKVLKAEAERLEKLGQWGQAADKYERILQIDRTQEGARKHYQECVRRYFQVVRLRDTSYRKEVLSLKYPQALRLYEIVLYNLLNNALDKDKVTAGLLFRKGLEEYGHALENADFCTDHLDRSRPDSTRELRAALELQFGGRRTMTYEDAVDGVRQVVMKSVNHFPAVNPTTVVMEFLCGACHAMDEYTVYLTPRQLRELCDTLKGKYVGVGIRLKVDQNKIIVAEVLADSPAGEAMPPLASDDHIVQIDKKATSLMTPEAAMELLEGEDGTSVELVVASPKFGLRVVNLRRRGLFVPSVSHELRPSGFGYMKIHCFQESTLEEFDNRLAELLKANCKGLILDLRGNSGGLLDVSIEIAKRFLSSGIVVTTQYQDLKSIVESRNPNALTLPVVILVDSDTASAAEVLAGALKENKRARVIGQTTYGKGCSQGLLKLPAEGALRSPAVTTVPGGPTGGIRITIARFYSPTGQPYTGRGVEPDVPAEGSLQMSLAEQELGARLMNME